MFLKQKEKSHIFDFSKIIHKKPENKKKNKIVRCAAMFMNIQLLLGLGNLFSMQHYVDTLTAQNNQIAIDYAEMQKAMKSGDQDKSIALFSKLKNQNTAVSDLFIGGNLLLVQSPPHPDTPVDYNYKLTPQTIKTLNTIYTYNLNSGIAAQTKELHNIECLPIDLTCYIGRHYLQEQLQPSLDIIHKKVLRDNYNVSHINEYLSWQTEMFNQIQKGNYTYSDKNPGQVYVNSLK